jgi:hypothetical protein
MTGPHKTKEKKRKGKEKKAHEVDQCDSATHG